MTAWTRTGFAREEHSPRVRKSKSITLDEPDPRTALVLPANFLNPFQACGCRCAGQIKSRTYVTFRFSLMVCVWQQLCITRLIESIIDAHALH